MLSPDVMMKLETLVHEVATREGCELYDLDFGGHGGRRTLRIFIDKADGGAGIAECSQVSRGVSEVLDLDDPIPGGAYDLEVSTPGVDRLLRQPWHFAKVVGKKIQVRSTQAMETFGIKSPKYSQMKQLVEVLTASDESGIEFNLDGENVKIPYSSLEKAKVYFDFGAAKGEKKSLKAK